MTDTDWLMVFAFVATWAYNVHLYRQHGKAEQTLYRFWQRRTEYVMWLDSMPEVCEAIDNFYKDSTGEGEYICLADLEKHLLTMGRQA